MEFRNELYFLSNMFPCILVLRLRGEIYKFSCVEAAFQAMKCPERAHEFEPMNGFEAKKFGRVVTLRPDWLDIRLDVMKMLVEAKFKQNPELQKKLIAIKDPIVEDNNWGDKFWGKVNGQGLNHLGKILMELRDRL